MLAHDGSQVSAATAQRNAEDPFGRLGHAARAYVHAIGALAENRLGPAVMAALDARADQICPNLTSMPGWPTLRGHLAILVCLRSALPGTWCIRRHPWGDWGLVMFRAARQGCRRCPPGGRVSSASWCGSL